MKWRRSIIWLAGIGAVLAFIGTGCGVTKETRQATPSGFPFATPPQTPEPTPSATPVPVASATRTGTPPSTSTPSTSPTWTPLPTLSAPEAEALVRELFRTNRGCLLPCWWGITPGITPWEEARSFLGQFAQISGGVSPIEKSLLVEFAQIPVPADIFPIPLQQVYLIREGVVESMEIYPGNAGDTLSHFLSTYGPPEEIWISTYSTEYPPGVLPFMVNLFYPEQGILAGYGPERSYFAGKYVRGCQMEAPASKFGLWSPSQEMTYAEAAEYFRFHSVGDPGILYLPIEEAAGMDVKSFYETYKEPGSRKCLETPRGLWPEQL